MFSAEGLVSVVIPVHNRPDRLREAVASVLAQTYRPVEILLVDDGSTDGTAGATDRLALDHPEITAVIHQANAGPGAAREAGRLQARGEFIQYLDSDDLLLPRKLALQVAGLRAHPECGASYGMTRFVRIGEPPLDVAWKRTGERIDSMFPAFLKSRWWGTATPLFRSRLTDLAGPWTGLRNEEDWEYDCRIAALGVRLHYVHEFIVEKRNHAGDQLSRDGSTDPAKLRDRAIAHGLIYGHARRAGIASSSPEMRHFARELFLLSRQCGAAGLAEESRSLFDLAQEASSQGRGLDFTLYRRLADLTGWTFLGRVCCLLDRLRP